MFQAREGLNMFEKRKPSERLTCSSPGGLGTCHKSKLLAAVVVEHGGFGGAGGFAVDADAVVGEQGVEHGAGGGGHVAGGAGGRLGVGRSFGVRGGERRAWERGALVAFEAAAAVVGGGAADGRVR